jgi:hypothetical protein
VKLPEGDDWLEDECSDRVDVDADLVVPREISLECEKDPSLAEEKTTAGITATVGVVVAILHCGRIPGRDLAISAMAGRQGSAGWLDSLFLRVGLPVGLLALELACDRVPGGWWNAIKV